MTYKTPEKLYFSSQEQAASSSTREDLFAEQHTLRQLQSRVKTVENRSLRNMQERLLGKF